MGTNNEIRGEINAISTDRPEAELINRNTHGIPTEQFERSVPAEGIRLNRNRRLNSADNDAAELEVRSQEYSAKPNISNSKNSFI